MKVDCQSHVFPKEYVDLLAQNPKSPQVVWDGAEFTITYGDVQTFRLSGESYDPVRKLRDMDRAGIDLALISTNMPGPCMLPIELAIPAAEVINDFIAKQIQAYPGRFAGLASLPWQDPDAAIREMDRARDQLGLCGVVLYSHVGGRSVDAPTLEPVYAHAESKGVPIVLHPVVPTWGAAVKEYSMIPMMGLQIDTSFALLRLILSGVLERHPRLAIVMPHAGGVLPYMIGRIDHQTEVMGRGRDYIVQAPSVYLRQVYVDLVTPSVQAIRYAYEFFGAEQLVFGTDHPWVDPQLFVDLVDGLEISSNEKERIFGANAVELFDLA